MHPFCTAQNYINIPTATSDYNLNYTIEVDRVIFEIKAETKGYIGFGFTNISGMVQSDIFIGGVSDNGEVYFGDYYSVTTSRPTLDVQQDWELIDAFEEDNTTTVKFTRYLNTNDKNDIEIKDDLMNIIWSIGQTDTLIYHGFSRSTLKFNLISQTNGGENPIPPPTPK